MDKELQAFRRTLEEADARRREDPELGTLRVHTKAEIDAKLAAVPARTNPWRQMQELKARVAELEEIIERGKVKP